MKTQFKNLLSKITKEMEIEKHLVTCWCNAGCNRPAFNDFFENVIFMSVFSGMRYQTSIHEVFENNPDAQRCYRILRNAHYNFQQVLFSIGMVELKRLLEKRKIKSRSWQSRNKIYLVIDESVLDRTTDGFEEIKKLPGHKHCHVPINLILVIGDKRYHIPIGQTFIPAKRKADSKVDMAVQMIEKIAKHLKYEGYSLKDVKVIGDREYLCDKMNRVCLTNEMDFECKGKLNTKLIDENNIEKQIRDWINEEAKKKFEGFKSSCRLTQWCKAHKHTFILYKSQILDTKVLGLVKAVMTVPEDYTGNIDEVKVYLTTNTKEQAPEIIKAYREIRWIIEEPYHGSMKKDMEIEKSYQGPTFTGITNYNTLKCIGYILIMKLKNAHHKSKLSFGQMKRFLEEEYLMSLTTNRNNIFIKNQKLSGANKFVKNKLVA